MWTGPPSSADGAGVWGALKFEAQAPLQGLLLPGVEHLWGSPSRHTSGGGMGPAGSCGWAPCQMLSSSGGLPMQADQPQLQRAGRPCRQANKYCSS